MIVGLLLPLLSPHLPAFSLKSLDETGEINRVFPMHEKKETFFSYSFFLPSKMIEQTPPSLFSPFLAIVATIVALKNIACFQRQWL